MGWQQGMAVGELEKKKRKRENGLLVWALVWGRKWRWKVSQVGLKLGLS